MIYLFLNYSLSPKHLLYTVNSSWLFYGRRLYQSIETVWFWFILDHLEVCFVSEVVSCFKILILSDYSINTIWAFLFNRISNLRRINSKIIHINLIWINADIVKACRSWKIIKKLNLNKSNVFKTQLELLQKKPFNLQDTLIISWAL